MNPFSGSLLALIAAFLFGISPVLLKLVPGRPDPILLAGLLYMGSGIGLLTARLLRRQPVIAALTQLPRAQKIKFAAAIFSGGILAPLCLTYGIVYCTAFQVSALLNFETVAATLIAFFIFREHIGRRVWVGQGFVLAGALLISLNGEADFRFSFGSLLVLSASFLWSIDTNLTREIEDIPPSVLAGIKGLSAGLFNLALSGIVNERAGNISSAAFTLAIGAVCYGLSFVLYIQALRQIGTSRASIYFATGPFLGMLAAIFFLREHPPLFHWIAGGFMAVGIGILSREHHEHEHTHEETQHTHLHSHDEHHRHAHNGTEGPEPHEHLHKHARLTHSHPHLPDIHHRHTH